MVFERLAELSRENRRVVLCTVTQTSGSTPRKSGARMIVFEDGQIEGTIGGGAVEHRIQSEALQTTEPRQITVSLTHELAMCCGGQMTIFLEPLQASPTCIILGAGHIAEVLCRLASQAGFWVVIADSRIELLNPERLPNARQFFSHYTTVELDQMPFGNNAYVVVVTHDHEQDQILVEQVLRREFRYAALIGSQRKAKLTTQRCINRAISAQQVQRLRCPAGIDIGAETPDEIAFSVVAEMIQVRRGKM